MKRILPLDEARAVPVRRATTTLVLRDGAAGLEVLMVRRSLQASFMPGSYVFPGGAVDAADALPEAAALCDEPAAALGARLDQALGLGSDATAYAVAGLRECLEECGLWLGAPAGVQAPGGWAALRARLHAGQPLGAIAAEAGAALRTSCLQPWSRWVTPLGAPKRFDTVFLVAPAPEDQAPEVDAGETTALAWISPVRALEGGEAFPMEFATRRIVESLQPFADAGTAALLGHAQALRAQATVHPRIACDADGRFLRVVMPGGPGYDEAGPPR